MLAVIHPRATLRVCPVVAVGWTRGGDGEPRRGGCRWFRGAQVVIVGPEYRPNVGGLGNLVNSSPGLVLTEPWLRS